MGRWGFIAKEQGGGRGQDGKSLGGNLRGEEAFWLDQLGKILAESRPG